MKFETASLTGIGGREANQDALGLERGKFQAWLLADGLGGHRGGDTAAKLAVEQGLRFIRAQMGDLPTLLQGSLEAGHQAVINKALEVTELNGMRTTAVLLLSDGHQAGWAHVGDARLYLFHKGMLIKQTRDHSVTQKLVIAGEISARDMRSDPDRNRLIRVLGQVENFKVDVCREIVKLQAGDAFLLCSDGFWESVWEMEMEVDLIKAVTPKEWLELMHIRLLKRVDGSHDNYSAIAVWVTEDTPLEEKTP